MSVGNVKALCFDTGGTILDWHTGVRMALAAVGARHGVERDWAKLANEFRRRSLKLILNRGEHAPATMNFDDAHRDALDQVLADNELAAFTKEERRTLWWDAIHSLKCWLDFPDSLARLRGKFMCVSFTLLSFRIVMDTARQNGLFWDAVTPVKRSASTRSCPQPIKPAPSSFSSDPPNYRAQPRRPRHTDDFLPYLRERLAAYPGLSAVRLLRELRERGFGGGYTAVKRAVQGC
jgi:2-haloacid dehalogenase